MNSPAIPPNNEINTAVDIAHELESSPSNKRLELWDSLTSEEQGKAISRVNSAVTANILSSKDALDVAKLVEHLRPREIVELIEAIPNDLASQLVDSLDQESKELVETRLNYAEGSLGRLMDTRVLTIRQDRSVDQVLNYVRNKKLPNFTDLIFIVGKSNSLIGAVSLATLLEALPEHQIKDLMLVDELPTLKADQTKHEAVQLLRNKHFVSLPVVNQDNELIGRVTVDKIINVVNQEADQQVMNSAGLDENMDLFAPVIPSAKKRAVWLGVNLLTAILASWFIGLFSATLEQVVALAVLMPIVASMGGIAGSQTLTLTIRGLALNKVNPSNRNALLSKEVGVAVLNGILWSLAVGAVVFLWFSDFKIAAVITIAIFANSVTAAFAGWAVPLALNTLKIDPAIAGSVILTTVTDIVGFVLFLGLGTLWLL